MTNTTVASLINPVCSECWEPVIDLPPETLVPGLVESWSHLDGEPLCPVVGRLGYEPAAPIEAPLRCPSCEIETSVPGECVLCACPELR